MVTNPQECYKTLIGPGPPTGQLVKHVADEEVVADSLGRQAAGQACGPAPHVLHSCACHRGHRPFTPDRPQAHGSMCRRRARLVVNATAHTKNGKNVVVVGGGWAGMLFYRAQRILAQPHMEVAHAKVDRVARTQGLALPRHWLSRATGALA